MFEHESHWLEGRASGGESTANDDGDRQRSSTIGFLQIQQNWFGHVS